MRKDCKARKDLTKSTNSIFLKDLLFVQVNREKMYTVSKWKLC